MSISKARSYVRTAADSRLSEFAPSTVAGSVDVVKGAGSGAAQWWFAALDQRCFAVGALRWTTQVVGIHVHGLDVWIQLESAEEPVRSLVLHVTPGMQLFDALEAIERMIMRELLQ